MRSNLLFPTAGLFLQVALLTSASSAVLAELNATHPSGWVSPALAIVQDALRYVVSVLYGGLRLGDLSINDTNANDVVLVGSILFPFIVLTLDGFRRSTAALFPYRNITGYVLVVAVVLLALFLILTFFSFFIVKAMEHQFGGRITAFLALVVITLLLGVTSAIGGGQPSSIPWFFAAFALTGAALWLLAVQGG